MAGFTPGFDLTEAETLLSIAQQTYVNTPGNPPSHTKGVPPVPPPPGNWQRSTLFTPTGVTLLDNYWEVWENKDNARQFAIAVRGTVNTAASILADLLLPVIKARYDFTIKGIPVSFNLARAEPGSEVIAGVHAGFALSLLLMLLTTDRPLALTLEALARNPEMEIYITGHSQGASIAQLLTSYVLHSEAFSKASFKTYVFAPAKPGNDHYAYDLDQIAGTKGLSHAIVNSQDWVPQVPLTLEGLFSINTPNLLREYERAQTAIANTVMKDILEGADRIEQVAGSIARDKLKERIEKVTAQLGQEKIALPLSSLTGTAATEQMDSGDLIRILDDILDAILPTLNYAKGGAVTPVFGIAGPNPQDPQDYFWQHHLGNYLKYLKEQYGP